MIYNRIIKFDTDYWQVIEYENEWLLQKYAVKIHYPKQTEYETYDQFTDRLLKGE